MIGLDTNAVVRYLVQDDPQQARRGDDVHRRPALRGEPGFYPTGGVHRDRLGAAQLHRIDRDTISRTLRALLEVRQLWVERTDLVVRALRRYADSSTDFSDALIVELALDHGCTDILSFDARAKGIGMRPL